MKDLKHLYYFEQLLEDADNELVRLAKQQGRKCVGTLCYQIPEVLLELPGLFPVRLRAPRTGIPSLEECVIFILDTAESDG